ncbi:MAG: STAS domain-containing protein [Clostridiales bacterium]|nr:STAS domain-containing protein [Clostridiales bacterium]
MLFSDNNVKITVEDGIMTAYVHGEIDHHNAKNARRRVDNELESKRPRELRLDLSGVSFMDSSGLGLILGRYTKATELGVAFSVVHPTDATMKILSLAGGERLIKIER